jgi:ABC-2 type transport system permease protein
LNLLTLLRKEWLDVKRDKKLLVGTLVLPFFILPLIGFVLYASVVSQPPIVELINNSPANSVYVNEVASYITSHGGIVVNQNDSNVTPDVILTFPKGFYSNLTSLGGKGLVYMTVQISSNTKAQDLVDNALYNVLYNVSLSRISELINDSHTNVSPVNIREPLEVVYTYITPTHHITTQARDQLVELARIIALVLFPSATPVIFFITDGITGEKERRTLESLLASPISPMDFIVSKLFISMFLGLMSSLGDLIGIFVFSLFASFIFGVSLALSSSFAILIVVIYIETVLLTAAISLILLLIFGGSTRNIQIINFLVLSFGMVASFSALFINLAQVTFPLSLIYIIPYEQLSASLLFYVFGLPGESIFYLSVTLIASILLLFLSSRIFNPERLLLK